MVLPPKIIARCSAAFPMYFPKVQFYLLVVVPVVPGTSGFPCNYWLHQNSSLFTVINVVWTLPFPLLAMLRKGYQDLVNYSTETYHS